MIRTAGPGEERLLASGDLYSAALAYLDGRIDVQGDMLAALRQFMGRPGRGFRRRLAELLARLWRFWPESWYQTRARARRNVIFHYDHPAEFYRQFLDERLVYSCAYFEHPELTLGEAQLAKLDYICRKLELRAGERLLDIGCGFGALVMRAAERFGAKATGCTLSPTQFQTAEAEAGARGLRSEVSIQLADYRDLDGPFDKLASVGMVEHVGVRRLGRYFAKAYRLLAPDGLFLNHGITRPENAAPGPEWLFLRRRVFPGSELPRLSEVIRAAAKAGFEVLDVESLRRHYALTCRRWVERLLAHEERCRELAGSVIHRTWVLYLAASALSFESGWMDLHQVLLAKGLNARPRAWTRAYLYR
ncbi:MAG: class I SAM-dependent methyltransferase [Bryobacteraceae bacterium]